MTYDRGTQKASHAKQRTLIFGLILAYTAFLIIPALPVRAADRPASRTLVKRYEALRGLLQGRTQNSGSDYSCLDAYGDGDELPLEEEISADEYNDSDYSPLVSTDSGGYQISKATFRVPATLFGDGTNEVSCKKALSLAYEGMYPNDDLKKDRQDFIKTYYDTTHGTPYKLKDGSEKKAYNDVHAYMLGLISGKQESFLWWRDRIISQAFNTCWKWNDPANPLTSSTPDAERFNKDNWDTEQGGNKAGGYMVESAVEGRYDDGVINCDGARDFIFNDPDHYYIMGFGEGDLQQKLDDATEAAERQTKIDNVTGLFLDKPDGLQFCGVGWGMIPDASTGYSGFLTYVAEWLADGGTHPFTNKFSREVTMQNPNNPDIKVTLGANQSTREDLPNATEILVGFKDCLKQVYPTLEETLDVEFEAPSAERVGEGSAAEDAGPSCENDSGIMAWITCAAIDLVSSTFNWVDTQIQALLGVDREKYTDDNMYKVWASIRNIAFAILIIMMLVMVIGTAVGTQLLDAYTVKRALPRMVMAILFISLSWYITIAMIDLSNIVGNGVLGVMVSPFLSSDQIAAPTFASLFQAGAASAGVGVAGVGAAIGIVGAMFLVPGAAGIILGWVGTGLLIVAIAFLVLVLRQMMIIALMIFAPVAILSWIFPGNDKLWKFWWSTFSKLLIMFPMIMALIAAGRIFSYSIAVTSEGVMSFILKFSAYVIPYLMIPMTFKFAGGALASISGMANDKSRGAFDRLRKGRQQRMGNIAKNAQNGNLFGRAAADSRLGRWNRRVEGAANIGQAGLDPRHWRTRMRTAMNDNAENEVEEVLKDPSMTWAGDDAKVHAARYTRREDISRALEQMDEGRFAGDHNQERRNEAVEQILRSQQKFGHEAFQRARIRAQAKTGTGYQDENGEFNAALMLQDINEAYGNDRNGAGKALAEMRGMLTQSGQIAGQAGYGTWAGAMENMHQNGNNATNAAGRAAHRAVMQDTIDSVNPGYAVHGKPSSARALASAHRERIQNLVASMNSGGDLIEEPVIDPATGRQQQDANGRPMTTRRPATMEDVQAAVAAASGILDGLTQASPQNASAFAEELMDADIAGITLGGGTTTRQVARYTADGSVEVDGNGHQVFDVEVVDIPTTSPQNVRELIDGISNLSIDEAPAYHQRKKEYTARVAAAAQAQNQAAAAAAGAGNLPPGAGNNPGGP